MSRVVCKLSAKRELSAARSYRTNYKGEQALGKLSQLEPRVLGDSGDNYWAFLH